MGYFCQEGTGGSGSLRGFAERYQFDPKTTPQKDCVPVGVPTLMFYPVADTISVERDRVVMKIDWMNSERTIFLDGRKHPPASETFLHVLALENFLAVLDKGAIHFEVESPDEPAQPAGIPQ